MTTHHTIRITRWNKADQRRDVTDVRVGGVADLARLA